MKQKNSITSIGIILSMMALSLVFSSSKNKPLQLNAKTIDGELKFIPAGQLQWMFYEDNCCVWDTVSLHSFYAWPYEITNGIYCRYLSELFHSGDSTRWESALPDTAAWSVKEGYHVPYVTYYLRHPAYENYPVVGVSYEQCVEFCQWLTEKYNRFEKRKYKKIVFDLPNEKEWMYAATGGIARGLFPWGGPYLRNSRGIMLANFINISQANVQGIHDEGKTIYNFKSEECVNYFPGDNADVTAPVNSYWPNSWGLYNMSGNVEEFVKEPGISKGGSWFDTGYYLRIWSKEIYDVNHSASRERGFRIVMHVLED